MKAIDEAAMGRLIQIFKTFNTNSALHAALSSVKKARDNCAHQGYLLTVEEQRNHEDMRARLEELREAHREAEQCFQLLVQESRAVERVLVTQAGNKNAEPALEPDA